MKRGFLSVIAAGLTATTAMATNINLNVQQTNGAPPNTNAITVAAGGTVNYKVIGTLTDNINEGLALIGLSLDFTGGPLTPANTPVDGDFSCANPLRNFVKPEGMTNPDGYDGTVVGGDLIQCGGAQNTINNTADNAAFPVGAVLTGVAQPAGCGPAVILTGSLTVPLGLADGAYLLKIIQDGVNDPFANVIVDGEDGSVFWATEAAGIGTVTNLTINVSSSCTAPLATKWESVASHLPNYAPGDIALEIPADATPGTLDDSPFSEPRGGITKLVVTLSGNVNAATVVPGNVVVTGRDINGTLLNLAGIAVGASATASNNITITFTPALPDYAKYRVKLDGVEAACGPLEVVSGAERIITALQGDANNDRRVNATDVAGVRGLVGDPGTNPIADPSATQIVRSDANDDGRVNATDVAGVRSKVGRDARTIVDP